MCGGAGWGPEAGMFKENKKVIDSGKRSSSTIYTANIEMQMKPTQGRMRSHRTALRLVCSCIS